jgi:hypothetical protein
MPHYQFGGMRRGGEVVAVRGEVVSFSASYSCCKSFHAASTSASGKKKRMRALLELQHRAEKPVLLSDFHFCHGGNTGGFETFIFAELKIACPRA